MADVQSSPHAPTHAPTQVRSQPQPHQLLALALGLMFVVVGIAGWTVTGGMGWTGHDHGRTLAGFAVNPLHNLVHGLVGVAGLVLWRRPGGVRGYGLLLALLYGAVLVYGLLAAGRSWDVLNVNKADNLLHLGVAVLGLVVAAWPRPRRPGQTPAGVRAG
jgi:hypothetical protein